MKKSIKMPRHKLRIDLSTKPIYKRRKPKSADAICANIKPPY
jgi:hypothetical protein